MQEANQDEIRNKEALKNARKRKLRHLLMSTRMTIPSGDDTDSVDSPHPPGLPKPRRSPNSSGDAGDTKGLPAPQRTTYDRSSSGNGGGKLNRRRPPQLTVNTDSLRSVGQVTPMGSEGQLAQAQPASFSGGGVGMKEAAPLRVVVVGMGGSNDEPHGGGFEISEVSTDEEGDGTATASPAANSTASASPSASQSPSAVLGPSAVSSFLSHSLSKSSSAVQGGARPGHVAAPAPSKKVSTSSSTGWFLGGSAHSRSRCASVDESGLRAAHGLSTATAAPTHGGLEHMDGDSKQPPPPAPSTSTHAKTAKTATTATTATTSTDDAASRQGRDNAAPTLQLGWLFKDDAAEQKGTRKKRSGPPKALGSLRNKQQTTRNLGINPGHSEVGSKDSVALTVAAAKQTLDGPVAAAGKPKSKTKVMFLKRKENSGDSGVTLPYTNSFFSARECVLCAAAVVVVVCA